MPVNTENKIIRTCELCGKTEGKELKSADFYDEAPIVKIKNHAGEIFNFQLNIDCWPDEEDSDILDDVLESADFFARQTQIAQMPQLPFVVMQPVEKEQSEQNVVEYTVCKVCFNMLVKIISNYGKFDKVENF